MKKGQRLWTRDELILAINLYCKLPFGLFHSRNREVIALSELINRTSDAVAFKLSNFASLDPSLKERGIKGLDRTSKLDKEVWNSFYNHWETFPFESEMLLAKYKGESIEEIDSLPVADVFGEGLTRRQMVSVRVNQLFFRKTVLSSYNFICCITGISQKELLIAGHIRPWGIDEKNRLNPRNGISINALHDKAFEHGYMTITPDYIIRVSPNLLKNNSNGCKDYFEKYENQPINLPSRFLPDIEFLKYHNQERFKN